MFADASCFQTVLHRSLLFLFRLGGANSRGDRVNVTEATKLEKYGITPSIPSVLLGEIAGGEHQ